MADTLTATLERAAAGDEAAFARIVAAYHADLVRVAYGVCGDPSLAQDAAQSAWLIAWRKLGSIRRPEQLRSWLVAVAANEARHLVRRSDRRHVAEIPTERIAASSDDPSAEIDRVDLVNALGRLSAKERSLLALRYAGDLDSTELAPLLGISASGVRVRLMRTLDRLRRELDDD